MKIDVQLIKELRELTGAGMMDCKKALEANEGDIEKAKDWLREKGITTVAKKSSRIAAEGKTNVLVCENCGKALIIEINAETDFVSIGEPFAMLVDEVSKLILHNEIQTLEEAQAVTNDLFIDATIKMGEKITLRRFEIITLADGQAFGNYSHMNGKISVLLVLNKENAEAAKGLAMHIAANNPTYIDASDISSEEYEHELNIQVAAAKNDESLAKKPDNILKQIVGGRVKKHFSESTLSEQTYLLDDTKTVGQFLKENGLVITKFVRYQVGEGIEKREENFADEVAKQMQ